MKKLMIAAAIVCVAAFAQAGQIVWGNMYELNDYDSPESANYYSGTVKLISGTGADFFAAVAATDYATALASATVLSSATLSGTDLSSPTVGSVTGDNRVSIDAAAGSWTAFMTAVDDDGNFYISEDITATIPLVGSENYLYMHDGAYNNAAMSIGDGYTSAGGWYTAPVPEPTSGLLLLLGMAGLALRRRRA